MSLAVIKLYDEIELFVMYEKQIIKKSNRKTAADAVRKSSFIPLKKGGKPVLSRAILRIKFTLRRAE